MVKNNVVKKFVYDKLVANVNNIDTSGFVLKTKYDTDKSDIEIKIPVLTDLLKEDYNAKTNETECKITSIRGLATTSALTSVENKIGHVSNLVKKQIMTQKLVKLKRKLLIIIMINILLLENSISLQQKVLRQIYHK